MPTESTAAQHSVLAGLAAAGMLAAIFYGLSDPGMGGDSGKYLTVAQNMLHNGCVSLSVASTGECLPHWGGNQFPGYPALIAVAAWLSFAAGSPDPMAFVPGTIVLQSLLLAAAGYRLSLAVLRLTGSLPTGLLVALLVGFSPLHFAWSRWILTETAATAAVLWIFAELVLSLHRQRLSIVPLGLALAVAFFVRYDTLPLTASVVVTAFVIHPPVQALRRGILVALILALPVAGWTARNLAQGLTAMPQADYGVGYRRGDGYYSWLATWTRDFYEAAHAAYPFANRKYSRIAIPQRVFEEPGGQEARDLLAQLADTTGQVLPAFFDGAFLRLAEERRSALPLQVFLINPLYRTASVWLSPAYSFGWQLELGFEAQRLVLTKGTAGIIDLLLTNPWTVAGKAALAGYRYLLTIAFLGAVILALARPALAGSTVALVLTYCVAKTLFVVSLGQEDPRLTTQPYVLMEIAILIQSLFVLRHLRRRLQSRV